MKHKSLSRGPDINTETCVENVGGNKYNLVLIAAARAREIKRQNRDSDKREHVFPTLTALEEIQEGKVGQSTYEKLDQRIVNSVGRVPALHAGCRQFEPVTIHQIRTGTREA